MYAVKFVYIAFAMLVAKVQATTSQIEGYGIGEFTWEVETSPGGPKQNITGTVQDVVAQLSAINPNWEDEFHFHDTQLQHRDLSFPFTGIICDVRTSEWGYANVYQINEGIDYLNGVPGTPTLGPGPSTCARVSCSWDAAIYWCNDETQTFSLPGFSTIAAAAQTIVYNCDPGSTFVNGQIFAQFLQNWNVIVRADSC